MCRMHFFAVCAAAILTASPAAANGKDTRIGILLDSIPLNDVQQLHRDVPVVRGEGADVVASVTGSATVDSGIWTYEYVVKNAPESPRGIWRFALDAVHTPLSMSGPEGWDPDSAFQYYGQIEWFCVKSDTLPPDPSGQVEPSPYNIAPGDSAVFTFTSSLAPVPGHATFYVQGFHEIPVWEEGMDYDSLIASQPGFHDNSYSGTIVGPDDAPAGVRDAESQPETGTRLRPGEPNPMTTSATFGFALEKAGRATLAVYNAAGRRVRVLVDRDLAAGPHLISWDGRNDRGEPVAAGVYFYQLLLDGERVGTQKSIVVR